MSNSWTPQQSVLLCCAALRCGAELQYRWLTVAFKMTQLCDATEKHNPTPVDLVRLWNILTGSAVDVRMSASSITA